MHKKVIILGSGASLGLYNHKSDNTVWCPYSMNNDILNSIITLFFGMHEWEREAIENIIDLNSYPLKEIVEKYGCTYFTNTISYMIAYALFLDFEEIELYGIDMTGKQEYIAERGSVMYWIGFARAMGVKVYLSSEIDKPSFLYGYEPNKNLKNKIEMLAKWANLEKSGSKDENQKNQYIGFLLALDMIEKEL